MANLLVFFDGEKLISVNPGGTVRIGLPCFEEAESCSRRRRSSRACSAANSTFRLRTAKGLRIHQVVSVLRNPKSEADMERLGLAVFDVVEHDGEKTDTLKKSFGLLDKWFAKGKLVQVVEHVQTKKTDEILALLADWVIEKGSEGLVLQHDTANWYKIKLRHNLDAAIIGYSEGSDERKGLLHDLLVAVVRNDGTFHELTRVGGGFRDEERKTIAADLKKRIVPSDYVAVNNDYVAYEMIKPGPVIELSCLDLITESSRGGPVNRMVLKWDGKRYNALSRMPLVSVISPQFVRIRDDKEATIEDVNIHQLTDIAPVASAEKSAEDTTSAPSQILQREVYTKTMKDKLMVRKLLLWKTNKEEKPEFPAYVVYLTDFSPNRADPLQREIRIAATESAARKQYERMAKENFIGGWGKLGEFCSFAFLIWPFRPDRNTGCNR
ncbi:MAG: ATP-dependent DNA ligase [Acidobacteria bacterium]|nr:ATP-dependent DNA ligase [Acidobacteriota bacterium]